MDQSTTYKAEGTAFKHEDTTKEIRVRFLLDGRFAIRPTDNRSYVAKVADSDGNVKGVYPTTFEGRDFIVKSADLVGLGPGNYHLEIWEQFTDKDNAQQTAIFPTPNSFVTFSINPNIDDGPTNLSKDVSFQDIVNQAVVVSGRNLEIAKTRTLPAGFSAEVTQTYQDGKNVLEFAIPEGSKGDDGKSAYQIWLDAGNKGTKQDFLQSLKGNQGEPGPAPEVGNNGNWFVDGKDLGKPSQGAPGKTPQRGVDYWTADDQKAIKDDVTKIVGDAYAKAKSDVEDAIINGKW